MITFIVPTYRNVAGLETLLQQLHQLCTLPYEVIVLFQQTDGTIPNAISVCTDPDYEDHVKYLLFETPSLPAKVNYAASVAANQILCVLNDCILLSKLNRGFDAAIFSRFEARKDEILAIYLCSEEETDNDLRYPFVSRRVVDLSGYLYHPLFALPFICERWIGEVLNNIGRVEFMKGCPISDNLDAPSTMSYNDDVRREAELLYKQTGKIRRWTSETLLSFTMKGT